jgi:hypothetical protein
MTMRVQTVPLSGSHRTAVPGSRVIGPAHPHQRIEVTLRLRPRAAIPENVLLATTSAGSLRQRPYLTREQLAADHGASSEDISKVVAFAHANHLAVVETSLARRSIWLAGTVDQMSAAFGVRLEEYDHPAGGTFRGRTGSILIPADLEDIVVGVFGLDNRPQAQSFFLFFPHPHNQIRTTAPGRCRHQRAVHGATDRPPLRFPRQPRRHRAVHWDHRAGRWIQNRRPEGLLFQPRTDDTDRHERLGRRWFEHPHQ